MASTSKTSVKSSKSIAELYEETPRMVRSKKIMEFHARAPKIIRQMPFNDDPFYIPGYMAYVPQRMFRYGNTFGTETRKLLSDKNVRKSKNTVLSKIEPMPACNEEDDEFKHTENPEWIKQTWGDKKYVDPMVPGYSGVIPMQNEFYGRRYSKICADSRAKFTNHTENSVSKPGKSSSKYFVPNLEETPLTPLAIPRPSWRKHPLPQDLSVIGDRPITFPMSYAGFIPRQKDRFAKAYRPLTYDSIKEFVHDTHRLKHVQKRPVQLQRQSQRLHETDWGNGHLPIYREEGEIPNYAGHLPGHTFRHGQTYAASSRVFYNEPKKV